MEQVEQVEQVEEEVNEQEQVRNLVTCVIQLLTSGVGEGQKGRSKIGRSGGAARRGE